MAELYAGSLTDFNDSMAQAIENALTALVGPLPSSPQKLVDDRRALFIAISEGVINHLAAKNEALKIEFDVGLDHYTVFPEVQVRP
jgi:hypothetical protein